MHIEYASYWDSRQSREFFMELTKDEYDDVLFQISRHTPFVIKRDKLTMVFFPNQVQRIQFTLP